MAAMTLSPLLSKRVTWCQKTYKLACLRLRCLVRLTISGVSGNFICMERLVINSFTEIQMQILNEQARDDTGKKKNPETIQGRKFERYQMQICSSSSFD